MHQRSAAEIQILAHFSRMCRKSQCENCRRKDLTTLLLWSTMQIQLIRRLLAQFQRCFIVLHFSSLKSLPGTKLNHHWCPHFHDWPKTRLTPDNERASLCVTWKLKFPNQLANKEILSCRIILSTKGAKPSNVQFWHVDLNPVLSYFRQHALTSAKVRSM